MKLVRAEFENFRLLRDLELHFSTDPVKKLTIIRAANESGKTTVLNALQWGLYGDVALPGKGEGYRLHPIDWEAGKERRVPITVSVDFEVTTHQRAPTGPKETRRVYRIVRSAYEEVDVDGSAWRRAQAGVRLFALTPRGAEPMEAPEAFINDELPPELREVFFTDGDRALSFIEADVAVSTKRDRVQRAIRALLGLGVIEDAIRHVQKAGSEVNKQAKKVGGGAELVGIASKFEAVEGEIARLEGELEDAKQQFEAFDQQLVDVDKKISAALQKGDREKLRNDMEQIGRELKRLDERIEAGVKEHSALFRSRTLAADILAPILDVAFAQLEDLRDKGEIPNTTIPVLEERLRRSDCICGESLDASNPDGVRRRQHIEHLIESSRKADEIQMSVTDLYFGAKPLQRAIGDSEEGFNEAYRRVVENRDTLQNLRDDAGQRLKAIEVQIDSLPDSDVQGLREMRRDYSKQRDRFNNRQGQFEAQLEALRRERQELMQKRDALLRERNKGDRVLAELEVTQDLIRVLRSAYERLTKEELRKVSNLMNTIFLGMIGADPEQGAIVRQAEISDEFDIIVFGSNRRTLNPDRDLNGASRRALTLAFILALTKVSDVEAPNVIDTPLGMMSGYVKRSVLQSSIRESSQLVLFLTHAEIEGCEEILDEAAGVVATLTNPTHYPRMLMHNPEVKEAKVLRCQCDHRRTCRLCERRTDAVGLRAGGP